jgi:hypothetical protein
MKESKLKRKFLEKYLGDFDNVEDFVYYYAHNNFLCNGINELLKKYFKCKHKKCSRYIKQFLKKKSLKQFINMYKVNKKEKIPTSHKYTVKFLIHKLKDEVVDLYKRLTEQRNYHPNEHLFTKIANRDIPEEITLIILSYAPKTKKTSDRIGLVNSKFYLLLQKSWDRITIKGSNVHKIPYLVKRYSKRIDIILKGIINEDVQYLQKCICYVKHLRFFGYDKITRLHKFLRHVNTPFDYCEKLTVSNFRDLEIVDLSSIFPKLKHIVVEKNTKLKEITQNMKKNIQILDSLTLCCYINKKNSSYDLLFHALSYTKLKKLHLSFLDTRIITEFCYEPYIEKLNVGELYISLDRQYGSSSINFGVNFIKFVKSPILTLHLSNIRKHDIEHNHLKSYFKKATSEFIFNDCIRMLNIEFFYCWNTKIKGYRHIKFKQREKLCDLLKQYFEELDLSVQIKIAIFGFRNVKINCEYKNNVYITVKRRGCS